MIITRSFLKSIFLTTLAFTLALFLISCSSKPKATVKVGTIAGPETQLMEVAKKYALKHYGLEIKIVSYPDYTLPNVALNNGDIDANMFQTMAYLISDSKAKRYNFMIVGKTFIYPMALYSKKITSLSRLPNNAVVAIPNDPTNQARALLLLQGARLISLKPGVTTNATPDDIEINPKNLKITPVDAAQLPKVLQDVMLAAINTNYAIEANLYPSKHGLVVETKDSPYANVVVVKAKDINDPRFQQLIASLHSPDVLKAANKLFKGQAIPAW